MKLKILTILIFLLITYSSRSIAQNQCGCDYSGCPVNIQGVTYFDVYYGSNVTLTAPQFPSHYLSGNSIVFWMSASYLTPDWPTNLNNKTNVRILSQQLGSVGGGQSTTFDPYNLAAKLFGNGNGRYDVYPNPDVYFLANGNSYGNYYPSNECWFGRSYRVHFLNIPTPSITNSNLSIWKGQTTVLNAQTNVGTIQWYTNATFGNLLGTGNSISVTPSTTTTYYARVQNGTSGLVSTFSDFIPVTVTIMQPTTNHYILSGCNSVVHNSMVYTSSTTFTDTIKSYQGFDSVYNIYDIQVNIINPTTNQTNISGCNSVAYNGELYTKSILLTDTIKSYQGCDSIYNMTNIMVNSINPSTYNFKYTNCSNVNYNGVNYTSSTQFIDTIRSYQGCDSIYNNVTININPITPITNYVALSGCNQVTYDGVSYTNSTVAFDTVRSYQGCDSIYNVLLITINNITPTTKTSYVRGCNSVVFNSKIYTSSTSVVDTIRSFQGCDSIYNVTNLIINKVVPKIVSQNITGCNNVTYNGKTYSSTNFVKDTLRSYQGCDSIYRTTLIIINKINPVTKNTNINSCSSVVYNSKTYTKSSVLIDTVRSYQGCDSIYNVVTITINPINAITKTVNYSGCTSYLYKGHVYNTSTTVTDTLKSVSGCDSIYNVASIKILSTSVSTTKASICAGSSYIFNGNTYTTSGIYTAHITNAIGCDSAATLNLTVKAISTSTTNASICTGGSYTFNGTSYTKAGSYTVHLNNSVGCDSAATLNLIVKSPSTSSTNASICSGGTYTFNGSTYTTAGSYTAHLTNAAGCDSAATLNLIVKSPSTSSTNASICAGGSYTFNGTTYTKAGSYTFHLINSVSCDSAATLNLTVKATSTSTTNASICLGGSYTFNGSNYTKAGSYTAHLTNSVGCDSAATLNLSVKATSTSTTNASICAGASYIFNGSTYTQAGTYTAHLTNSVGCDSAATLILTVKALSTSITNASICSGGSYTFNGTSYSISGRYTAHLSNSVGCDSTATLNLTVKSLSTSTTNASICVGGSYTFNGTVYTTSGIYVKHLSNAVGCDSAATLVLTVKSTSTSTTNASICANSSYTFNGSTFTKAGSYTAHLTNAVGCDSAATLILTVKSTSTSTTNASICAGGSYIFNGLAYTSAGTYKVTLTNSTGCDSVASLNLTVKATTASTTTASVKLGDSYLFNGTSYTASGTYTAHLTNSVGCDSVATLRLTVINPTSSSVTASICTGGNYLFNGASYTTAGTYTAHLTNAAGGDSIVTLILIVNQPTSSTTNASICAGSSYTFNGSTYTSAGSYIKHLTNSLGCDSAATLNLKVNATSTSTTNASICTGGAYTFNGSTYTSAGSYTAHLTNSLGCDSTATLVLTVKKASATTTNASICIGSSYTFNGTTYTKAGSYIAHLTNAVGCDSVATLVLVIKSATTSTTNASICLGGSYTLNGAVYNTSGTYTAHLTNAAGCDSAATLNLTVKSTSTSTTNASICLGGSYTFNGSIYSVAGSYTAHLTNSLGCDSTANLVLVVKTPSTSTTNVSICAGGSYAFNGNTYTKAGSYIAHLTNAVGCDSIATLNLIVKPNSKDTIIISTATPYTWHGTTYTKSGIYTFDTLNSVGCDSLTTLVLNSTLPISFKDFIAYSNTNSILLNWNTSIEVNTINFVIQHSVDGKSFTNIGSVNAIGNGANNYDFTDKNPISGTNYYRLQSIDKNGAVSYSKVVTVQFANANRFTVYPNPAKNVLTISGEHIVRVQVLNNMGRVVNTQSLHDAKNPLITVDRLSAGVYHLRIQTMDGNSNTVGFIKQ